MAQKYENGPTKKISHYEPVLQIKHEIKSSWIKEGAK